MDQQLQELTARLTVANGRAAAADLMIAALIAQAPDKDRLMIDFAASSDGTAVRIAHGAMPEVFFESLQTASEIWMRQIEASRRRG